ncbi:hypothetical protein KAI58_04260 [Candidatus Gracilibacteria bacterium]|nr:hypothetical protein [Candidatus Gracilibacteria bacterium]
MKKQILVLMCLIFPFFNVSAINKTYEERAACFETLKSNMSEIGSFQEAYPDVLRLDYKRLEEKFSPYYKSLSSFGIDIDEPLFEMRLHSFGLRTGYQHPPFSPFPVYTKADKWEEKAKKNIIVEEYLINKMGKRQFLGCAFFTLEAADLMQVRSENYLYDGELISVLKNNSEENYKAWYTQNVSFNHKGEIFADWKRLFIYPETTKNSYFNRYEIAESFPSNEVQNFRVLNPKTFNLGKGMVDITTGVYLLDENGESVESLSHPVLSPIKREGKNELFGINSYYEAIENQFPLFAKHLALRGILKYETLKKILSYKDADELIHIWSMILDPRSITTYVLQKEADKDYGSVKIFDEYLEDNFEHIELEANYILRDLEKKAELTSADDFEKQEELSETLELEQEKKEDVGDFFAKVGIVNNSKYLPLFLLGSIFFLGMFVTAWILIKKLFN